MKACTGCGGFLMIENWLNVARIEPNQRRVCR